MTLVLVTLNVVAFLPSLAALPGPRRGGVAAESYALFGPAVAAGEWWRLVTSGFLHYGLAHLAFNLAALWLLGRELEPALGAPRFVSVYVAGLLGGALGALLLSPHALTAGASGAVFGLMGTAAVAQQRRGIHPWQSGIGGLLVVNLLITFAVPGISVGGHVGGLLGGGAAAAVAEAADAARLPAAAGTAAAGAVALLAASGALAVA